MTQAQILAACKRACRIFSSAMDSEFNDLIQAAYYDLEISGIADTLGNPYTIETTDQLVLTAIKTYVKIHFGDLVDETTAKRLDESYWSQKAQLKMRNYSDSKYEPTDES